MYFSVPPPLVAQILPNFLLDVCEFLREVNENLKKGGITVCKFQAVNLAVFNVTIMMFYAYSGTGLLYISDELFFFPTK